MKAHELIQRPENWTQHEFARDKNGQNIDPQHKDAVCFCTLGAIAHAYPEVIEMYKMKNKLYHYLNKPKPLVADICNFKDARILLISVGAWNDTGTHKVVYDTLKLLDI